MRLRVYGVREHYREDHRKALNDILKALWNSASPEERRRTYGDHVDAFESVDTPEAADVHLLTMRWPYYVEHGCTGLAIEAIRIARRAGKPIAVFSTGDHPANVPVAGADIHVFEHAGYRSRDDVSRHGMPAFIDDLLHGEVVPRPHAPRAQVGFCGQGGTTLRHHVARAVRNRANRLRWRVHLEAWEPPPMEHTWFRRRVLATFQNSRDVESRFIIRQKYRAGVHSQNRNDPNEPARREFLDNLANNDYALCMRGGGNFSQRFYEAMAIGRIPIFIDSDCLVPFRDQVDWKRHTIWIDERDLRDAPRIVAQQHARFSAAEFAEIQRSCRAIWRERLTPSGFYRHFHEHFPELASLRERGDLRERRE